MYYYMKMSQNIVNMYDGILYSIFNQAYYISTKLDFFKSQELGLAEREEEGILGVYFEMSDEKLTITRTTETIADAFAAAGGLMSVIFVVITIVIQYLQKTIYST